MDLYLTSAEPGLTLQEMIDCDIKSGVDFESGFPGDSLLGAFDFPNLTASGFESDLDLKSFEPLFDPLNQSDDEAMDSAVESKVSFGGVDNSPIASWMNLSSMTNFNFDLETSLMVNPSVVLPSAHHPPTTTSKPTDTLTLNSTVKMESGTEQQDFIKKSQTNCHVQPSTVTTQVVLRPSLSSSTSSPTEYVESPLATSHNGVCVPSQSLSHRPIHSGPESPNISSGHLHHRQLITAHNGAHSPSASVTVQSSSRSSGGLVYTQSRLKSIPKYRRERTPEDKTYPKPAYSYACLIALALKNSLTGSLPVSEIYNFMCEHFPYFRTAPNGWKNSVRHNLSLNKCFEKIEKPVVSGSNQRKGCLWALNPLKIHKMDDEVQKWSKKDLQGIKDAMTCPEILSSLEKGEMKFEPTSGASSCSEDEEDEDLSVDLLSSFSDVHSSSQPTPIKVISSSTTLNGPHTLSSQASRVPVSGLQQSQKFSMNQMKESEFFGNANLSRQQQHHHLIQTSVNSNSASPEYILPESSLPEINIQSNGTLIDDYGNEITLDGELSILNPRNGLSALSTGGTTNLILKKVSASSLRNGATAAGLRSNFVYAAASPTAVSSGLPSQNGISRLVLTNAKLS